MEKKNKANQVTSLGYIRYTAVTPVHTTEFPAPEAENIGLLISIQNSVKNLREKLRILDFYVNKYFPVDKNTQQVTKIKETKVRRIV